MTNDNDLKPCPFCGGEAHIDIKMMYERMGYMRDARVECRACGVALSRGDTLGANGWATGNSDAEQKTIAAWNSRAIPAAPPADVTEDHEYTPDPMMMGDCSVCGHTRAAHAAPHADVAGVVERLRNDLRQTQAGPDEYEIVLRVAEAKETLAVIETLAARIAAMEAERVVTPDARNEILASENKSLRNQVLGFQKHFNAAIDRAEKAEARVVELEDAASAAHEALVSARAFILRTQGTVNKRRDEAIEMLRAALKGGA